MSDWKTYRLGDFVEVQNGFAFKASDFSDVGIPVIKIKNITPPRVSLEDTEYYKGVVDKKLEQFLINKGDILISMTGSHLNQIASAVGKVGKYQFDFPSLLNQRVGKLFSKSKEKFDEGFLYYFISRLETQIDLVTSAGGSANQANISPSQIKNLELKVPSLKVQQSIAHIFSSLDDKIELNRQMNQTLEAMAQAIFKEWFVNFNFPGFSGELMDGLPKGWKMGKLSEVCKIEIGRTPPRMEEHWFSTDSKDTKWISIRDLGIAGVYIFKTYEYLTKEAVEKFRIPIIPENTVVLSFKLTIGRLAITTETMLSNEAIAQIKSNIFSTEYIYTYLKTYNWATLGSTSSIATAINSKIIKEMEILIPENKVEKQYQEMIRPIFERLKTNSQEIETLTKIRDSLLPKLMTGKIKIRN